MNSKKKALGRGLNALLSDDLAIESFVSANPSIPIENIIANPYQPRSTFEEKALEELSISIKNQGIIQPITVKKIDENKYQLISGERRLRASKMAGLTEIPAYIREVDDNAMLELALVENIQRENLNSIEVALSFQRLIEECSLTQETLSEKVGKSRSSVSNHLRLIKLPPEIQIGIRDNIISMGHARALISIVDENKQIEVFNSIIKNGLSVRDVESLVRNINSPSKTKSAKKNDVSENVNIWKKDFANKTQAKINIKMQSSGRGTISISFNSPEHLNKILNYFD